MGTRKSKQKKKKQKKERKEWALYSLACSLGPVCYVSSKSYFHILNNITCIFTYIFTHIYFKKLQTTILKLFYQTLPKLNIQE